MFGIGQAELIVILFIVLLFFGPDSLPKLSKTVGESAGALRDGFTEGQNDKSLKDIAEEVRGSARDIKLGLIGMSGISQATENIPVEAETEPDGYGEQGYGKEESS